MPISNACAAEEILLWIHKGQVVTVWSSVLWSDHLDLYLTNQSDRSMQDNRVGVIRGRPQDGAVYQGAQLDTLYAAN